MLIICKYYFLILSHCDNYKQLKIIILKKKIRKLHARETYFYIIFYYMCNILNNILKIYFLKLHKTLKVI